MRAVVLQAFNSEPAVQELEPIALHPRDVRVKVDASGVCHSDLTVATGGFALPLPIVLGHEGAGVVTEVGADVAEQLRPGDRVIVALKPVCGVCWFCARGQTQLCELASEAQMRPRYTQADGSPIPSMSNIGSMAEEMTVDMARAIKVTTSLPGEQLALLGCGVTTGVGAALNTAAVEPGATVAVFGCGGVGQGVIQGARIAGAGRIIAVDPVLMKRTAAMAIGATDGLDPAEGPVVDQLRELTDGRGVDYAFEGVGNAMVMTQCFDATRRGGTVIALGMARSDVEYTFPGFRMMAENKRVLGCYYGSSQVRRDLPRLVALAEMGRLDLSSMVSQRLPLERIGDAFEMMERGEVIRSVLVP